MDGNGDESYDDEGAALAMSGFVDSMVGYIHRLYNGGDMLVGHLHRLCFGGHDDDSRVVAATDMDGGESLPLDVARRWAIGGMADMLVHHLRRFMDGHRHNDEEGAQHVDGDDVESLPLGATLDASRSAYSDAPAMGGFVDMMVSSFCSLYNSGGDTLVDYFRRLCIAGKGYADEGFALATGSTADTMVGYVRRFYAGGDMVFGHVRRLCFGGHGDDDHVGVAKDMDGESLSAGGFVEMMVGQFCRLRRYLVGGDEHGDGGDAGGGDGGESLSLPVDDEERAAAANVEGGGLPGADTGDMTAGGGEDEGAPVVVADQQSVADGECWRTPRAFGGVQWRVVALQWLPFLGGTSIYIYSSLRRAAPPTGQQTWIHGTL